MPFWRKVAFALAFLTATLALSSAQVAAPPDEAVRVTVSMNADGSKTTYEFDSTNHRAIATTTGKDRKLRGKIRYALDEAGRFMSGDVYGPDEQLRFKTLYKYEAVTGRLAQEVQLSKDEVVQHKIVYAYDNNGKQTGYTVYDAAGKRVNQAGAPAASATPANKRSK